MVSRTAMQWWSRIHTWSSLVCTAFLLVLCVTGLPLIFADEIEDALRAPPAAAVDAQAPKANIDDLVAAAQKLHPDDLVRFAFVDDADGELTVVMAPADSPDRSRDHRTVFDAHTGMLKQSGPPASKAPITLLETLRRLHIDLYAGPTGEWLLAGMGGVFVLAFVSGAVLYLPYYRSLGFGKVRTRSRRIRWLDLHNLLGVCVLVWALLVGVTGILNELSKPLSAYWRKTEMSALLGDHRGEPASTALRAALSPAQAAYDTVSRALPERNVTSILFPSTSFSNPRHYLIWTNGNNWLTSRLFTAALVDARSGELTAIASMPFYLRALQVSRPLHFGDYGGIPLKLLWAALDLITIVVLVSGLYLWWRRRHRKAVPRPDPAVIMASSSCGDFHESFPDQKHRPHACPAADRRPEKDSHHV